MHFEFGEGLPGKTWSNRRAIVLTDLHDPVFKRTEVTDLSGISCAIAVPIFCGEFFRAVLLLFCGHSDDIQGAVEIWHNEKQSDNELRLLSGFYGSLDQFEWISQRLSIMRGRGLPGKAWADAQPLIMEDLANSNSFLRASQAAKAGITTGLSIPFFDGEGQVDVLTLLSANGASLARRFEVWLPTDTRDQLVFAQGHSFSDEDLHAKYQGASLHRGEGLRGGCWHTGLPTIGMEAGEQAVTVAIPVISNGLLTALVCITL